ncbi:MAG: ABC transporter permease [Bacilli bacterium]|nr:ABC transporter permease [Bacilli bacterium]
MRAYLSYFKLKFISGLQYRSAALAGIATQFFFGFVYIMVYVAFYESGSSEVPMELSSLITYVWLNQSFFALINQFYKDPELFQLIRSGNISYELSRPKNMYFLWYFKILGQRLANVVMRFFPLLLVTSFLPEPYRFSLPNSLSAFGLFLLSLLIGTLLVTAISTLYPILTLLTMNEKGIVNIVVVIADLLSGVGVPIVFFPEFLKRISACLPFQYISDLPFRIYVGNISIADGIFGMMIQFIWLILMILLGAILMKRNLKRVVVQGG